MKDVHLSDHGIDQARHVGDMIGHLHFDRVISSPLVRAWSTAEYVLCSSDFSSEACGELKMDREVKPECAGREDHQSQSDHRSKPDHQSQSDHQMGMGLRGRIETDRRLEEQHFGIFEGLTYDEIGKKYPEDLKAWNSDYENYRIRQGESFLDVRRRIDSFAEDLLQGEDFQGDGKILITAHKGTFGHLLASLLGLAADGFWNFAIDQGCYSRIDLEDGYAILRKLNSIERESDDRESGVSRG